MSEIEIKQKDRRYRLNFNNLIEVDNIEFILLRIIYEELPITLRGDIVEKYSLEEYVKQL